MVISPLAPDQTIAQMWSNEARGRTPFQRTTNGKYHMGYQIVTWPMTSRDPKGAVGQYGRCSLSIILHLWRTVTGLVNSLLVIFFYYCPFQKWVLKYTYIHLCQYSRIKILCVYHCIHRYKNVVETWKIRLAVKSAVNLSAEIQPKKCG